MPFFFVLLQRVFTIVIEAKHIILHQQQQKQYQHQHSHQKCTHKMYFRLLKKNEFILNREDNTKHLKTEKTKEHFFSLHPTVR